ncbi:MAG: helix-turn-helix domain-containing protein [Deltaproteobacteria bacterium]|nr:helix-turn-helix domain-containing protein [Deltaproteobacteria bacterium]
MRTPRPGQAEIRPYPDAMAGRPPSGEAPPFGKALAALRKERGLTQEGMAELLGVSRKTVDYYERRAQNPSAEVIERVADKLGVGVAVLLGREEIPKRTPKAHPGPVSALELRIEKLRKLPRAQQEVVVKMLDGLLG